MAKIRGEGSVKRFGARYGRKIKAKLQQIESEQKKQNKCPYCLYKKIKRLSKGIFVCEKCNSKFTGRAYNITKEIKIKEEAKPEEASQEEEQESAEEEDYQEEPEAEESQEEESQEDEHRKSDSEDFGEEETSK